MVENSAGVGRWGKACNDEPGAVNFCFLTFTPRVFVWGAKLFDLKTINTVLPNGQEPCDGERIRFHFIRVGLIGPPS